MYSTGIELNWKLIGKKCSELLSFLDNSLLRAKTHLGTATADPGGNHKTVTSDSLRSQKHWKGELIATRWEDSDRWTTVIGTTAKNSWTIEQYHIIKEQ